MLKKFHKKYYEIYPNDLHLKHELWYYMIKYRISFSILKYLEKLQATHVRIADVGGGYGYDGLLIRALAAQTMPSLTIDIDVIDPTVNFYNDVHALQESDISKQNNIAYIEESLLTFDTSKATEKYDIIICSEVIEHLRTSEQEIFFAQFNRILKPGGLITLTCPNGSSLFKQLIGLLTWKRNQQHLFEAEFHYRYSHIGVPTIFQVLGLFQRKGFQVGRIYPSSPVSATKVSTWSKLWTFFLRLPVRTNLFLSTTNVYVAKKEEQLDLKTRHNTFTLS